MNRRNFLTSLFAAAAMTAARAWSPLAQVGYATALEPDATFAYYDETHGVRYLQWNWTVHDEALNTPAVREWLDECRRIINRESRKMTVRLNLPA